MDEERRREILDRARRRIAIIDEIARRKTRGTVLRPKVDAAKKNVVAKKTDREPIKWPAFRRRRRRTR